jgi:hypothetical protein
MGGEWFDSDSELIGSVRTDATEDRGVMVGWQATAAYLYVLRLHRLALAWEYMRRNPDYRLQWQQRNTTQTSAAYWGCAALEDPDRDARDVTPVWLASPDIVSMIPARSQPQGQAFSVWNTRNSRQLTHTGTHLQLQMGNAPHPLYIDLDPHLEDGEPFAYLVNADHLIRERLRAVATVDDHFNGDSNAYMLPPSQRLERSGVTHARTLQALDGVHVGASHRDVAIALFGEHQVHSRWTADGELRAQVRYLIRRGKAWINGGYRSLLQPVVNRSQGEKSP